MDVALVLTVMFLMVFLVLALLLIHALRLSKETYDPNQQALPPSSQAAHTSLKRTVFKMLVMRPWPYKDLWTPLNRLYWPDEQPNNRAQRRHSRRKKQR
jgi:hypothetical protein